MKRLFLTSLILILLASCAGNPPAPVVNRSPQSSSTTANTPTATSKSTAQNGDWRPDTYIVKKGDTLYSIGLNLGLDYREIAAANNIYEPFTIRIGQQLNLSSIKARESLEDSPKQSYENEDGVIISAVDVGGETSTTQNTPSASAVTPVLSSPKATREPYSLEALNRTTPITVAKKETVTTIPATPEVAPTATEKSKTAQSSGWKWPTKGKVIEGFHPANNKGIDISGKMGQSINASAAGKVIYAGSDLRGYGKLVIVKHNKTFLSVYAHNSKILVQEGQQVRAGQVIAKMGNTDTNKVKLHFEIRERGKSIDPTKYLPQNTP